jgi:hypothetical protein
LPRPPLMTPLRPIATWPLTSRKRSCSPSLPIRNLLTISWKPTSESLYRGPLGSSCGYSIEFFTKIKWSNPVF